ncbi:helix-turn-helix domain-containing protein [Metabacillus endolithicus]|uniref:Helix-turn-helix domain-containing protein n=1 Tax=Metabacillus endolithicus TaxID=1535204 RepID=A0ABW5C1Z3_9BACI|nr:helix-turn-helix domain-containing protein [Metabacillus endolithicus]UPG65476.1 AraC family transcriptional regulator [Metabacillus endolithicus]
MNKHNLLEDRVHGDSLFPLRVYMVDYLDGQVIINMHWHPELEFIYVEEGQINLQIGTRKHRLSAGSACLIPSEQLHGAYPCNDQPFKIHAIVFHINLIRSFGYDLIESNFIQFIKNFSLFHSLIIKPNTTDEKNMLKSIVNIIEAYSTKEASYELKIKGYLFLLFADILRKQAWIHNEEVTEKDLTKTELLKKVLQYIDQNYKQKLTVMDLASQVQMSEGHFSRFFKSLVRMTPMEYINTIRISKACTLLQKSDRKILDIAMDVGFQNHSYFIRLFKKQKGCTPGEYKGTGSLSHS